MMKVLCFIFLNLCYLLNTFGEVKQQCPAGFYCPKAIRQSRIFNNDDIYLPVPCPPGTFSALGQDDCTPCEPGYYANASGFASCTACQPGFMCKEADKDPVPCPLGTYSSCTGQMCCSACPIGTYTPNIGSIECVNCPAGIKCPTSPKTACGGDLLSARHQAILSTFAEKPNAKWKIIYKATRDGFGAADFHRLCDGQRQTMTIIQSTNGYLFGGYANAAWNSSYSYTNDPRSFLFTLTNPHSILPTRYLIKGGYEQYALYNYPAYGPTFGIGYDLYVSDKSNTTDSSTNFGYSYTDTTYKSSATFTGNSTFRTTEIEVYKLLG